MKTDSFINRFFREYPGAFFTLLGEDERKAKKYKFTSLEVKEQAFRFDGVFLPKTKDDLIYFVEAQFSKELDFYPRFLGESFVYLRQYQPANDWRAVVIFPDKSADPGIHPQYREFFESGRLQRIYLNRLPEELLEKFPLNLFQIILNSEQRIPDVVKKIVRQLPSQIPDAKKQEIIIELFVNILTNKLPKFSLKEYKKMLAPLFSQVNKKSRLYQDIVEEVEQELAPKIAQELTPKIAHNKAREIAKSLLRNNMNPEFIAEVTGLSKKEVRALSKSLAVRRN
jgi:predicted transposase/invertase (TIGR01784 family)